MRAVIVGAGVIGSSIALELARSGFEVTVVDRDGAAGHGSTSASSAVVRFNFSTLDGVALAWESRHRWQNWDKHLGSCGTAGYRRIGLAMLDVRALPRERMLPLFDHVGVPYEQWDADTLATRVAGIDVGRYWPPARLEDDQFWSPARDKLGAVFTGDAGYVDDPVAATADLATAAARHGARFRFHRRVTAVLRDCGRTCGVRLADGEEIAADVVINALGPWSGQLNRVAGVGDDFRVGVRPLRQEVHHVPAPPGYDDNGTAGPVVADIDLGTYVRGDGAGGLVIGGTEPECDPLEWLDDPDQAGYYPSKARFDLQVARVARRFPHMGVPEQPKGVVGVYDVADDWTPIYDRTDLPGFYVAIGTSGNQFKNAPVIGLLMNTLVQAVEGGADHDRAPVGVPLPHTGHVVDMATFSRLRSVNTASSGTVIG